MASKTGTLNIENVGFNSALTYTFKPYLPGSSPGRVETLKGYIPKPFKLYLSRNGLGTGSIRQLFKST